MSPRSALRRVRRRGLSTRERVFLRVAGDLAVVLRDLAMLSLDDLGPVG